MTAPSFVASAGTTSAGGAVTDDDVGFSGAGLVEGDKILLFPCFGCFAFAAANWPAPAETRVWSGPLWQALAYPGAGPFTVWTTLPWVGRYANDDSNLRVGGNSAPDMIAWVAYRDLPTFTNVVSGIAGDADYSGSASDTLTVNQRANYCTGGTNLSWLVFTSTVADAVPTWPSGVTERLIHHSASWTIAIGEESQSGSADWPARSVSYTGTAPSGFGGVGLTRLIPLFRQDGDA